MSNNENQPTNVNNNNHLQSNVGEKEHLNYENKFEILYENVSDNDSFNDTPHGRVAKYLARIINDKSNNKGITIGLEGGWGTGKSTIIDLLKKELGNDGNSELFIFDAWAHEGDSLRRVFLESLAKTLFPNDIYERLDLKDCKNESINKIYHSISGKYSSSEIKSTKQATTYGTILGGSILMVPLGSAIFAGAIKQEGLYFKYSDDINLIAIVGVALTLAPFLVTIFTAGYNCYQNRKQKNKKETQENKEDDNNKNNSKTHKYDLSFFTTDENKEKIETFKEGNDRTSVEFETFFKYILELYYKKEENYNKKLVIVIDNLDRIEPDDAKKIWSTLQTFLQYKSSTDKNNPHFNNIFVIIPYDSCGIAKIWDKIDIGNSENINREDTNKTKSSISKSFLDKSFQLRIDVPKISLTNWKKFAIEQFKESLTEDGLTDRDEWKHEEYIDEMVEVLARTRNGLDDIPTPREIKTYINQVNLLRQHANTNITNEAIACYVIYRYNKNLLSVESITKNLIDGVFPDPKIFNSESLIKDISGIIFHTNAEKGYELLLGKKIEKCIGESDIEEFSNLAEVHITGFWNVLSLVFNSNCNRNISMDMIPIDLIKKTTLFILKLSTIIFSATFRSNENKQSKDIFIKDTLSFYINNNFLKALDVYEDIDSEYYINFINNFDDESIHKKLHNHAMIRLEILSNQEDININTIHSRYSSRMYFKNVSNIIEALAEKNKELIKHRQLSLKYERFNMLKLFNSNIFNYVIISTKSIPNSDIVTVSVSDKNAISEALILMFEKHNHFDYDLTGLIDSLIQQSVVNYIEFIYKFISSSEKYNNLLEKYKSTILNINTQTLSTNRQKIFYSLFVAQYNIISAYTLAISTWQSEDGELIKDALAIFSELKNYKREPQKLFFNVAMDTFLDYKLAINICFDMYKKPYGYYEYKPLLGFIEKLSTVFKSERLDEFIIVHEIDNDIYKSIIKTLKDNESIDLNYKSSELNKICEISNNKDLHEMIAMVINNLPADSWGNLFTNTQSGIIKTAMIILNKIGKGFLSTNYLSAFENITKTLLNLSAQTIDNEMWQNFIDLLETNSRTVWKDNLATHILSTKFNLHASFIELNFDYFNYKKIARTISPDELDLVVNKLRNIFTNYNDINNSIEAKFYITILLISKTQPTGEFIKLLNEIIQKSDFKDKSIEKDIEKLTAYTKQFI